MDIAFIVKKLNSFYQTIDPFAISYEARRKMGIAEDKTFVYGEALPESLAKILKIVEPKKGEIFYDLGSGGGKVVLAAAMMFPFGRVVGIEKLEALVVASEKVKTQAKACGYQNLENIQFRCQDFLEADFTDADVIFINSTCLSYETMDALAVKMESLKNGARIVTVTKQLRADYLKEFESKMFTFSWGEATVYFYKKLALR